VFISRQEERLLKDLLKKVKKQADAVRLCLIYGSEV